MSKKPILLMYPFTNDETTIEQELWMIGGNTDRGQEDNENNISEVSDFSGGAFGSK
jgi:hypothetical protein